MSNANDQYKREFCPICGNGVVVAAGFKHDPDCPRRPTPKASDYGTYSAPPRDGNKEE